MTAADKSMRTGRALPALRALTLGVLLSAGCAEVRGGPPGGPEDHAPPKLLKVTPDTGTLNRKPKEVVFRFDETVSERPAGANGLEGLVVLSPSDGVPRVSWHRKAITVRPRKGFRANTAYTVTLLPGIADLRGNVLHSTLTTYFSTGGEIPRTALRGIVFDWVAGKPAPNALVQLFIRGDTTFSWVTTADSTGRFVLRGFPSGSYRVRALIDANNNRAADPREAYDTLGVAIADSARVEFLAFVHDSLGPRIDRLNVEDSLTLRLDFDLPYEPTHPVTAQQFTLKRADSTVVPVVALLSDSTLAAEKAAAAKARGDSLPPAGARRASDSTRVSRPGVPPAAGSAVPLPNRRAAATTARDTTPIPKPSRPSPIARVIIRLGAPLRPGASYRLSATDVWGLSGAPRSSDRVFTVPKQPPPVARDTAARRSPAGALPASPPATVPNGTPPRP
ncbi:MAG: Ig-like domain-containing protein [Gemmatimonadaceae bacterium]